MTIREIIQRVQSLYSRGAKSDDSRLSSRHIYSKLLSVRALLIFQKLNKKQELSDWNYQTIDCVEMIEAHISECPCLPPIGCKILRTRNPLPKPINSIYGNLIKTVMSLDYQIVYSRISFDEYKYKKDRKYSKNIPDYYIKNDYLYITTSVFPKYISITGVFNNPAEALKMSSNCSDTSGNTCLNILDSTFTIDEELIEPLIQISVQELIGQFSSMREDTLNNTKDNTAGNMPAQQNQQE